MTTITREQAQKIIEAADEVITALAGTNEDVHPESDNMLRLWDELNDRYVPPEVVRELARIALASLEAPPVYFVEIEGDQDINAGRIEGKTRFDLGLLPDGINFLYANLPVVNSDPIYQVQYGNDWCDVERAQYDDHAAHGSSVRVVYAAHPAPEYELKAIVERLNASGYECGEGEVTTRNAAAVVDILLQQLDEAVQGRDAQPAALLESLQHKASGNRPAVWVRLGDNNHAPDCTLDCDEAREWESRGLEVLRMVAPTPPPVVPDERVAFEEFIAKRFGDLVDQRRAKNGDRGYMAWDMCIAWIVWQHRAAMLQGAENAESLPGIKPAPALDIVAKNADSLPGNSPVIPDGWKLWVSDVIEYLENGLEADGELEAQGSIDAKRLLAAAPQQEVK